MPKKIPSLDEFKAACRREFAYLIDEFGFVEEPLPQGRRLPSHCIELPEGKFINGFAVWFRSGTLRIIVEGVNWGRHAALNFGMAAGQTIGFGHVAAHYSKLSNKPQSASRGQMDDVKRLAAALRESCEPLLRGDRSGLEEAFHLRREMTARQRAERELLPYKRDAAAADEAFRRKDYTEVVRLLSRHLGKLSPAEERRLEFARKHRG